MYFTCITVRRFNVIQFTANNSVDNPIKEFDILVYLPETLVTIVMVTNLAKQDP